MAKMLNDVTFTASERLVLLRAFNALDDIATRCGHSGAQLLRETMKHETTGSHSVSRGVAIGFVCDWFLRATYSDEGAQHLRDFLGARNVNIAILADYARYNNRTTQAELELIQAGEDAKNAAIHRANAKRI